MLKFCSFICARKQLIHIGLQKRLREVRWTATSKMVDTGLINAETGFSTGAFCIPIRRVPISCRHAGISEERHEHSFAASARETAEPAPGKCRQLDHPRFDPGIALERWNHRRFRDGRQPVYPPIAHSAARRCGHSSVYKDSSANWVFLYRTGGGWHRRAGSPARIRERNAYAIYCGFAFCQSNRRPAG